MRTGNQERRELKTNDLRLLEKHQEQSQLIANTGALKRFLAVVLVVMLMLLEGCFSPRRTGISTGRSPDDRVLGTWVTIDFVKNIEDFTPEKQHWTEDLFLKELTFYKNGTISGPWVWKKDWLIHPGDHTSARYAIIDIEGTPTLFLEWISGDVTIRGQKPWYYVLMK